MIPLVLQLVSRVFAKQQGHTALPPCGNGPTDHEPCRKIMLAVVEMEVVSCVNPLVQMAVNEMRAGIVYLDLSSCDLSSLDAGILAAELEENATVKTLILTRNPIGPAGVEVIAKACQGKASLTNLQLSFNMMGLHGVRALGRTLAMKQSSIRILKLTDDHIGDGGARGLARGIAGEYCPDLSRPRWQPYRPQWRRGHRIRPHQEFLVINIYHCSEMKSGTLVRLLSQRFCVAVAQS
jgi:hypothetical protein